MKKIFLIISLNFIFPSSGSIFFGDMDNINKTIDLIFESTDDILGIQIELSGVDINYFSGGAVEEYSFDIFNQGSTILSFGASDNIPAGSGLLTTIHYHSLSYSNCFIYAKMVTYNANLICGECSDLNNQEDYCEDIDFIPNFCNTSDCIYTYYREILPGSNLISFWKLPIDKSIVNVLESCGSSIIGIIGEGIASSKLDDGSWVGSIDEIDCNSGYWVLSDNECAITFQGDVCENNYELHEGINLISYPFNGEMSIGDALPGYVEEYFTGIIGEGVAATQITLYNWVGSLTHLKGGEGYWVNLSQPVTFSFTEPDGVVILNLGNPRVNIRK